MQQMAKSKGKAKPSDAVNSNSHDMPKSKGTESGMQQMPETLLSSSTAKTLKNQTKTQGEVKSGSNSKTGNELLVSKGKQQNFTTRVDKGKVNNGIDSLNAGTKMEMKDKGNGEQEKNGLDSKSRGTVKEGKKRGDKKSGRGTADITSSNISTTSPKVRSKSEASLSHMIGSRTQHPSPPIPSKSGPPSPRLTRASPSAALSPPQPALIPTSPKLLKRFYESLVLLAVFGPNRGERTSEEEDEEDEDEFEPDEHVRSKLMGPAEERGDDTDGQVVRDDIDIEMMNDQEKKLLRRQFTRHLAYLCDYEKGGDSTTAIALERTREAEAEGVRYWVASNRCQAVDRTVEFLRNVLTLLGNVEVQEENTKELEEKLLEKAVAHAGNRISAYAGFLKKNVDFVLDALGAEDQGKDDEFMTWLQTLRKLIAHPTLTAHPTPTAHPILTALCRFSYETVSTRCYHVLQQYSQHHPSLSSRFSSIKHILGRLNHTLKAIKILLSTHTYLSFLFPASPLITRIPSPPWHPPPLLERNPSLSSIIGRMLSSPPLITQYRAQLSCMDHQYNLTRNLHSYCTSPNWRPRIHAELIILSHFYTHSLEFVAGDKYIACSKAACYCCWHYMRLHPGGFVVPSSHRNSYMNWRAPDVEVGDERGDRVRRDVLNQMAEGFRREVLGQVDEMRGPGKWKPDSVTEVSSGRWRGAGGERDCGEEDHCSSALADSGDEIKSAVESEGGDDDISDEYKSSSEDDTTDSEAEGGVLINA
ncbi:UDP-N-acetylglucosamine--N-acetylmuramyl- pyrophosphoryl-undecaprenol N-acetylglucosamine transferase protein [Rutstroemia sp. NJR-2017a BVV2]|nr:UDP-N-acetylglucosamine--N-acetylmuramyl- pyrophosphoryl-undecaprenol N-acetylglucosamine transferase protein [Rutstroemia sp. NJR-2017a BVV2]